MTPFMEYQGKYLDHNNMTYRNADGSFRETYEHKLKRELWKEKWKMRHAMGEVDVETMLKEYESL